ncbi:galactofuranosylgalactofuranosylrhamnosyl-N-acetylglucosaminyl-diphospho-decaprenol beta-1,5/1,6-galactofuranosyltransferase [Naumannella cuiyingiana]|uniref:Galactofuranosylgalactofuranosylrhamnosyl-N-acetylglucosaminyl-diphospho-decaprenol beta-1,5/1,6-galactofuranosyltransferase n=1 Tax=Naumannella cuiyingiana TaxID=1347891 RepID=A0A7Z0DCC1_9ACTN|nr:glycosyltransferase [Naumannella cuiyingiana]NYI72705.1 galactofuranosylgalactofuranosylrhamnosyl-N-acetylglucosaminyl-diphospho-decaprenol beta-1,5/1,6-galactofuranosyltransferase [Naumannella cuiyingiana]
MTTTIQHVVFPQDNDPDILPLYADPETWTRIGPQDVRVSALAHMDNVLSRSSARVPAGRRVSYASYFNAFPAAYWQRWTTIDKITLGVTTSGDGTVLVYRSNAAGNAQRVDSAMVSGEQTSEFELAVTNFGDGGWYWFEIVANDDDVILRGGEWTTEREPRVGGNVSLGMTTVNKPDYAVRTLGTLAAEKDLRREIDKVYVVDQGTKLVSDEPGFAEVAADLGDQLGLIRQDNIGGSGGFSRGMAETIKAGTSDFVMLLDDDVQVEPEGIFRALQFARYARTPTIVGGHMFDLFDKPVLHAFAEVVDMKYFLWRPLFDEQIRHDFRKTNLRQTPWMHARMDADYNGWWMCLIPVEVVKDIGLSLPAFIKWDDSEYGLRAREAGYRTVSLPGAALWHVSWVDKDDSQDWQAYFHARNRIVAALLHSPFKHGGRLMSNSRRIDLKHLLSMQYYAVAARHRALRDILSGPAHMHPTQRERLPELQAAKADFPETRVISGTEEEMPHANRGKKIYPPVIEQPPQGPRLWAFGARGTIRHLLTRPRPENVEQPEVELAKKDAAWWRVPFFDSALISTADGRGKSVYRRDQAEFRKMLAESLRLHRELERRWNELAAEYQRALPEITSLEAWERSFAGE